MAEKKIELSEIKRLYLDLVDALTIFDPCYKEFIGSAEECIECCNSDFIVELEKLLSAFKDDKVKKAWEAANDYADDVKEIYDEWNFLDAELSNLIKDGGKK